MHTHNLSNRQKEKLEKRVEEGREVPWFLLSPEIRGLHYCSQPTCPDPGARLKARDPLAVVNLLKVAFALKLGLPHPPNLDRNRGAPKRVLPPSHYV